MAVNGVLVNNFPAVQDVEFATAQHVIVDSLPAGGASTDVTDRLARILGHVEVDNFPATQPISAASLPLPSGAASAAKQPTLDADGGAPSHVTNWPSTQPVSAASLPLPSGAATSAKQPTLDADGGAPAHITNFPATQPVSAAALPLPSGASTSANDTTIAGAAGTSPPALAASASGLIGWLRKIVDTLTGGLTVTGTFWQATQPISAASLPLPSGAATAAKQPALGTGGTPATDVITVQGIGTGTALKVDGSAVTQPVSGGVTANAGTNLNTSALATSANLTAGTAKSQVTDGTNSAAVKAASTAPAAADPALVVSLSPNIGPSSNNLLPSAAATINATVVKASAGRLYKIKGYNAKASVVYLKFWNKATTPAPASDAALIIFSFALKASDQFDIDLTPVGFAFGTGIGYTLSTGSANTDVAAVVAADVVGLNVMYA